MTALIDKIENNRLFKFIKDNFSLLIFIPSLLGGLKQLLFLLFYSPSLIQYFSFSQIAIDGLEIIVQGMYLLMITSIIYKITAKSINRIIISNLLSFIFVIIYTWYAFDSNKLFEIIPFNLTTLNTYILKLFSLTLFGVIFGNMLGAKSIKNETSNYFKYFKFFLVIVSIIYALYVIISYKTFQYNVKNIIDVTKQVRKETSKDAELIFYNDTYLIFISNPKDEFNTRKFYVKKFEVLFEDKEDINH